MILREPESAAVKKLLQRADRIFSTEITEVEVIRVARRQKGTRGVDEARVVLEGVELVSLDRRGRTRAGEIEPPALRSLDAIHLAAALGLEFPDPLFLGYDRRLQAAAAAAGLEIASPGA